MELDPDLVGSPDVILEKVEKLRAIGVDHATALMFPAASVAEFEDQVEWFAKEVMAKVPRSSSPSPLVGEGRGGG